MNFLKKAGAVLLAFCTAACCASCGENTANAMTVSDFDVRAGIYLYYVTSAYGEAIETMRKDGASFDDCETSKDYKNILKDANIDGVTAEEWIQNKAEEYCATFVAIEKEFDALGLTLTGDQLAAAESSVSSSMNYYGEYFTATGIGDQSLKDIILNSYKQDAVWEAYYGEGGSKNIEEQTLYEYYADHNIRIKYIEMPLKDGEGNLLKSDGKKVIEEMAKDFLSRLAKKSGDEAEMMEEFDYLIEENANYITSVSEAAVTTTDDEGNIITTPTTAKVTTSDDDSKETTAAADDDEEAVTTAAPDEDEDAEETTAPDAEDAAAETTETTTTTTVDEAESDGDTDADADEDTSAAIAELLGVSYDTSNERILAVSTAPDEAEQDEETETEPSYTPCEKVYNWAVDPDTEYLKPELIKDDECYYVVVKLNIEDRMVSSDLWNSSRIETVRSTMYYDEYLDMLSDLADGLQVKRNERAFKRYKVLDIDYLAYQNALYQSYYSMYGGY